MRWFDKPYTTDMHLSTAFRHWIGLPDHMLPDAWKKVTQDNTKSSTAIQCELYIANSTIPNAGLGIFTTRELHVGEYLKDGNPAIPVFDLAKDEEWEDEHYQRWSDPLYHYVWEGVEMGMGKEGSPAISAFWPGINGAVNSNPALNNIDASTPIYDLTGMHRLTHPGVGAFTPYHLGLSYVHRHVPVGGELFKDYGDYYFSSRDAFKGLPLVRDFARAEKLLTKFFDQKNKLGILTSHDEPSMTSFWKSITRRTLYDFILEIRKVWQSGRTLNALPDTYHDAKIANTNGISILHQTKATRDPEWLAIHGRCLDHILPKLSLLENAGHGGFARRFIPAGTIISASPLVHTKKSYFNMYEEIYDETNGEAGDATEVLGEPTYKVVGQQLVLNYCYGHPESSVRVCPYGSGVAYVNHNRTLANVVIRWAPNGVVGHNSMILNLTASQLDRIHHPTLGFEYVATRDIQQGEELYLDYGETYEAAWLEHVKNWPTEDDWSKYPPYQWPNYEPASVWNEGNRFSELLRTVYETIPYPENLSLKCHPDLLSKTSDEIPFMEFDWHIYDYGVNCVIIDRQIYDPAGGEDGHLTYFYDALIVALGDPNEYLDEGLDEDRPVQLVHRIPRSGFRYLDLPYTTDMHLSNAFRHPIGIPDDIFPAQWKN